MSTTAPAEPENGAVPIRFVLNDSYEAGETVTVAIENIGTKAYVFQSYYQACSLSYFDSKGRPFVIPPGTHCDLLAEETIRPGERKKLFTWKLDECVKDAGLRGEPAAGARDIHHQGTVQAQGRGTASSGRDDVQDRHGLGAGTPAALPQAFRTA